MDSKLTVTYDLAEFGQLREIWSVVLQYYDRLKDGHGKVPDPIRGAYWIEGHVAGLVASAQAGNPTSHQRDYAISLMAHILKVIVDVLPPAKITKNRSQCH